MILREKPDVVVVELDLKRFEMMMFVESMDSEDVRRMWSYVDNKAGSTSGAFKSFSKALLTSDSPFDLLMHLLMSLAFNAIRIKLAIAGGGPGTDGEEFLRQSERRSKSAPTSTWATATIKSPKAGA